MDKRTEKAIMDMIIQGKKEIEAEETRKRIVENEVARANEEKWQKLLSEAKLFLPEPVKDFLTIANNTNEPAKQKIEDCLFELDIDGLAPIRVDFNPSATTSIPPITYKVSFAYWLEGSLEQAFIFSKSKCGDDGETLFETQSLEVALAVANERYEKLLKTSERVMAEQEARKQRIEERSKEPVYENLDGSEPVPDQVLLSNLREIIREEIQKSLA